MLQIRLIDLVNSISVFQLAFFFVYIVKKGKLSISNKILLLFFLSQFVVIFNYLTNNLFCQYQSFQINSLLISMPLWFVWGPAMYFYIRSQIRADFVFKKQDLFHLLPFASALTWYIFDFACFSTSEKILLLNSGSFYVKLKTACLLLNTHVMIYNLVAFFQLHKYQQNIRNYSSSREKTDVSWLKFVLISYLFACICSDILFLGANSLQISNETQQTIIHFAFMLFFSILFYKAILNPQVLDQVESMAISSGCQFTEIQFAEINAKLEQILDEKKPYLNQNLMLKDLCDMSGIPERTISQVINQYRKQTFYTFINSYRIEEAKKLLAASESKKDTMLGIAFDSGFNSKSVFYDAFKKCVGMTPTEFRQLA